MLRKYAEVISLEILIKGGFFISGLILFFGDKKVFSDFTLLNSIFTVSYNAIAMGLPFIYAREIHKNRFFNISELALNGLLSLIVLGLFLTFTISKSLYILAAFGMIFLDVLYSRYRIMGDSKIRSILFVAGALIFLGNVIAGLIKDEGVRYISILVSMIFSIVYIFFNFDINVSDILKKRILNLSIIKDGVSFGLTHALFWTRNGLDKILLFPILGTSEYARYGFYFFCFSAVQTAWTSILRVGQKKIFYYVVNHSRQISSVFQFITVLLIASAAYMYLISAPYYWFIIGGAICHLSNQFIVNLINYKSSVLYYTISNVISSVLYLGGLYLFHIDVNVVSRLFMMSNLVLSLLYILFMVFMTVENNPALNADGGREADS